jgi:hypothetical protein
VSLTDDVLIKPVLNATVTVEGNNGDVFTLSQQGNGNYKHNQLPLVMGQEYRVRIKTAGNKEYVSDYVEAKASPEIDSVTWKQDQRGMTIYVNTHDATNKSRYYKWDFDETWEIRAFYAAEFQYVGGDSIVANPFYHYRCWKYASSTTINIGTTAQLAEDVLSEAPVHFISRGNERVSVRYSILVRQQALTKAAYEYFQLVKKNTESIGTIFDPQPSELRGNIRSVSDPSEYAIGFITASATTEKRMFVTSVESAWNFLQDCPAVKVFNQSDSIMAWVPQYLPWGAQYYPSGAIEYYYMAPEKCVDCTKRDGDLAMPSYW